MGLYGYVIPAVVIGMPGRKQSTGVYGLATEVNPQPRNDLFWIRKILRGKSFYAINVMFISSILSFLAEEIIVITDV